METICMKCQILFSGKNEKSVTYVSSAELAKREVKDNTFSLLLICDWNPYSQ